TRPCCSASPALGSRPRAWTESIRRSDSWSASTWRWGGLAGSAVVGGSSGRLDRLDLAATRRTAGSWLAVRQEIGRGQAFDEVLGAGAAVDRGFEDCPRRAAELFQRFSLESLDVSFGMQASLEQDLVGVDVADAR